MVTSLELLRICVDINCSLYEHEFGVARFNWQFTYNGDFHRKSYLWKIIRQDR